MCEAPRRTGPRVTVAAGLAGIAVLASGAATAALETAVIAVAVIVAVILAGSLTVLAYVLPRMPRTWKPKPGPVPPLPAFSELRDRQDAKILSLTVTAPRQIEAPATAMLTDFADRQQEAR